jgi:hypothetical protein
MAGELPAEPSCALLPGYSRLFPQLAEAPPNSAIEKGLEELGRKMKNDGEQDNEDVTAGYTYLGQFIDHDLTLDITPLPDARREVEQIPNFRTPFLDLDHVYAGGPSVSPFLYEMSGVPGHERFLIGMTKKVGRKRKDGGEEEIGSSADDLPRNAKGIALVGDPRQDENLVIAQLHVAFLKFHNCVLEELENGNMADVGPSNGTLFEKARRLVTWNYQFVVLHDFLEKLLDSRVYEALKQKISRPIRLSGPFRLPIEFSAAAFRFGHSMVRDSYIISVDHQDADLLCLLALTGPGAQMISCRELPAPAAVPFALPADWKVEWRRFFVRPPVRPNFNAAQRINTQIANRLHNLRPETVALFSAAIPRQTKELASPEDVLPVRTLWRGARMGLPFGQHVAQALGCEVLNSETEIAPPGGLHTDVLRHYGFHTSTPLWYYILKEAELAKPSLGKRLGPVGSRLVGDVIVSSLQADPCSFVSLNSGWQPVLGGSPAPKMIDILDFIGALD